MLTAIVRIGLTAAAMVLYGCALRLWEERLHALKWAGMSICASLLGYLFSSAALFAFDRFSVTKALAGACALGLATCAVLLFLRRKRKPRFRPVDIDLRGQGLCVVLLTVALLLGWGKFGFFGMGQDQGVYQTKAIDLLYGNTQKVTSFREYDQLETGEERDNYLSQLYRLAGLNNILMTKTENEVLPKLFDRNAEVSAGDTDGIYHGIPTYPAFLALFAAIGGLEHMAFVQTLSYVLTVLAIWCIAENLGLRKGTALAMACVYLLSPEALWVAKNTLTEAFLGLIVALFLERLTSRNAGSRWQSAFPVLAFCFFHVSIYAMFPMFAVLYAFLYLQTGERQYLRAGRVVSAGFALGLTFMAYVAPRYTIANIQKYGVGFIHGGNVFLLLLCAAVAVFVLLLLLGLVKVRGRFQGWVGSKGFGWVVRLAVLALLALSAARTAKGVLSGSAALADALPRNGLYVMLWVTGLIALPSAVIGLLHRPQRLLRAESGPAAVFLFLYCVLLMCCVLQADVEYLYYYGRYLTPYIPVLCLLAGLVWDSWPRQAVAAVCAAGALAMAPFDAVVFFQKDDTRASYQTVERVAQAVAAEGEGTLCAVFEDTASLLFLPVRAMTGADCYFAEESIGEQMERLAERYDSVFLVSDLRHSYDIAARFEETAWQDDNVSFRMSYCPLPTLFPTSVSTLTVYRCGVLHTWDAESLYLQGGMRDGARILLDAGGIQFGPYISLTVGTYRVTISGQNLNDAWYRATAEKGAVGLKLAEVRRDDGQIVYEFTLEEDTADVEFLTGNGGQTAIAVSSIRLSGVVSPEEG